MEHEVTHVTVIRTFLFSLFALCLAAAAPVAAQPTDGAGKVDTPAAAPAFEGAEAYKNHLEFLGYTVEESDGQMVARHSSNFNVILKALRGGMLLTSFFTSADEAKTETASFHNVINGLNARAVSVRYYADSDVDLVAEAWYPGAYDRERFGLQINEFNSDLSKLPELPPEEKRFLR
ncbi:MAG TPA: hypothetical protein VHG92_00415 [Afifellaceae bacterium]|nr:hypothetical protein [Afifellaceae bacterium]